MPHRSVGVSGRGVAWLVLAGGVGIGLAIARPLTDAPVGFDTQATVAYFDRLVTGTRLEAPLSTTPKPLLTLVYGALHAPTGDWRPIIWATILAHGAAAALTAVLATRVAGRAAGAAAGLTVAGTTLLVEDAAFGNAVPWALLGWVAAGAWCFAERPRPILAGTSLGLAALCRLETLVIVATIGVALAWARFGPWPLSGPRPAVPGRLWLAVGIPFLALPVMLVHDWLLTGDPFFWAAVSARYSEARAELHQIRGPLEQVTWFVRRYGAVWPAVAVAFVGFVALVRDRRLGALVGLAAMGPAIAVFLVLLAARGLYAPDRYALPVDLALSLLAAVGLARLATALGDRLAPPGVARSAIAGAVLAGAAGWAAVVGGGPFDPGLGRVVGELRTLNENAARAVPVLGETVDARPAGASIRWYVPIAVRPRIAVDLGVPLTDVSGLSLVALDPASGTFSAGQRVFHDRQGDVPRGGYAVLETGEAVRIGDVVLQPLVVDAARGLWLFDVIPAS